jgi:hypothetical protein
MSHQSTDYGLNNSLNRYAYERAMEYSEELVSHEVPLYSNQERLTNTVERECSIKKWPE